MNPVRTVGIDPARAARTGAPAFALVELAAVAAMLGLCVLVAALSQSDLRRRSRLAGSTENLHKMASGTTSFAADHSDKFWTFSWTAGQQPSSFPDLVVAGTDQVAQSNQAVDIIRRLSGLNSFPVQNAWLPHLSTSAVVLADHLGERLPAPWMVSPEDDARLDWQKNAQNVCASVFAPSGCSATVTARVPFSSSYETSPAFCSPDAASGTVQTISQSTQHNTFFVPGGNGVLGARRLGDVSFPSQKAMVYDAAQRHFGGRTLYFLSAESRSLVLAADGAAAVRRANVVNAGFQPGTPSSPSPTTLTYQPDTRWEPPTATGAATELMTGRHRWTRSGLRGRDWGGPEVPWVP